MPSVYMTNSHPRHRTFLQGCYCMPYNHVFSFCWPANVCSMMRIGIPAILCKDIARILYASIFNSISCLACYYLLLLSFLQTNCLISYLIGIIYTILITTLKAPTNRLSPVNSNTRHTRRIPYAPISTHTTCKAMTRRCKKARPGTL
jgi:hypothetical protein